MSSIIPDWTRAHRAGQIAFGSSRCPSTCSNTAASHGGSAWSRHPQTLPWATQQERNITHIRTVITKSCCIYMNDVVKTYRGEKRLSFSYNKWTVHGVTEPEPVLPDNSRARTTDCPDQTKPATEDHFTPLTWPLMTQTATSGQSAKGLHNKHWTALNYFTCWLHARMTKRILINVITEDTDITITQLKRYYAMLCAKTVLLQSYIYCHFNPLFIQGDFADSQALLFPEVIW